MLQVVRRGQNVLHALAPSSLLVNSISCREIRSTTLIPEPAGATLALVGIYAFERQRQIHSDVWALMDARDTRQLRLVAAAIGRARHTYRHRFSDI
jgi:hypothetical protein